MTRRPVRRPSLPADEAEQISALGVIAAAMFASLLVLVANTGYGTSGKIQMQNAADATAISGATWVARGLNLVSVNNVTQTQLLALYLLIPSIEQAAEAAEVVLQTEIALCGLVAPVAAICLPPLTAQAKALTGFQLAIEGIKRATGNGQAFWTLMRTLAIFSDGIVATFPVLAAGEAIRIARENDADIGVLIAAPTAAGAFRIALPARRGSLRPDLCLPTREGSPRADSRGYHALYGYDIGEGPLERFAQPVKTATWFWFNTGMPWFFDAFREANYRRLCGGSGAAPTYERPVGSLAECRARHGTAYWLVRYFDTVPLPAPQPRIASIESGDPRLAERSPITARTQTPCTSPPSGTPHGVNAWRTTSESRQVVGFDANGRPQTTYRYRVVEYRFVRGGVSSVAEGAGIDSPGGDGDPYPYLLGSSASSDAVRAELRYLAVTYRERDVWMAPTYFVSPLGRHRLAYAQAKVYNPTAFDLFTQDWRVSLEPASMIDDGTLVAALTGGALGEAMATVPAVAGAFRDGLDLLTGSSGSLAGSLNNH